MKNIDDRKILIAGATGYLGNHILNVLDKNKEQTRVVTRSTKKLQVFSDSHIDIKIAEVTKPETLFDVCKGIDIVISTVGITRQKDGLTYMDVDYKANLNLLQEAIKAEVKHFIYVSAINGDKYEHLKIFEAKEKFVSELKASGFHYTIVRPNGFFSDMKDFLQMAKSGRVYLFGDGNQKFNPISGEDLANFIYELLDTNVKEVSVGGPDILSLNEISKMALQTLNKPVKVTHLPDGFRKFIIWSLRKFTNVKTYGPIEFFLTLMAEDNIAPKYGKHRLINFFKQSS
ncbi:SDR family oxidoreductase [Polaribacter vadi]|uniref:SDR family oxidoreductase n=1 Tax=Polaribacter TaxID=52959 RepID=UPI001C084BC0|nr:MULTISPECIES: SDR family oxidoreductase [Polaribacter]MBU3010133.1 SDR family oxidoreductase [Polaribacter vadi]MDO6739940.1 SDR family oxidoreductase [Polaribacter sp. 1_MG-2023]